MKPQTAQTIALSPRDVELYNTIEMEVGAGVKALNRGDAKMAEMVFQSARKKLETSDPFYDHLVHNLLLTYQLQIEQHLAAGDRAAANRILELALDLDIRGEMADDDHFRARFAGVFSGLGSMFMRSGDSDASVRCCRKAISTHSAPGFQVNLENALRSAGSRAKLADYTNDTTPDELGTHIFIACTPKSGSTFLKNVLLNLTGYRDGFMVFTPGQFEQDIYLPSLTNVATMDTVTQQHCRASDANVQLMQAFEIRPVVLVRNIFDSVMSLLDFYDKGAYRTSFFRADYRSLDDETRLNLLIENLVPWYFQFVASWDRVEKQNQLDVCWLSYEEMLKDKPAAIKKVLGFYGLGAPMSGVEQRVRRIESNKGRTRFNKGVTGRGDAGLSEDQKIRIRGNARYFPTTDFSRIGL